MLRFSLRSRLTLGCRYFSGSCGIVGLPNIGKSTLFNALTRSQLAQSANYPFTTIEPNVAKVAMHDPLLLQLAEKCKSKKITPLQVEFVDVAGLVRDAHKGAGLGNQFLSNIRDVAVILHVLRCFDDPNIVHVESNVDPVRDLELIETELTLADLAVAEKRKASWESKATMGVPDAVSTFQLWKQCWELLDSGRHVSTFKWNEKESAQIKTFQLLTSKPLAYVLNVDAESVVNGNNHTKKVKEYLQNRRSLRDASNLSGILETMICASLEQEVGSSFDTHDAQLDFLKSYGVSSPGIDKVTGLATQLLQQHWFYTIGPDDTRAWNIRRGSTALDAAGRIHSDMVKGFICAEVTKPKAYLELGESAPVQRQSKTYVVEDGDIIVFKFNVTKSKK